MPAVGRPAGETMLLPYRSEQTIKSEIEIRKSRTMLKLDAKQEAAWQQADKASKDARAGMRDRMTKHHDEIKSMIDKPGTDLRDVAKRMDDFRAEGQKLHQESRDRWLAVYDTLNPEQKEKVRVFFKGMSERMGKMGRHGGRGDMDGRGQRDGRGPAPDAK